MTTPFNDFSAALRVRVTRASVCAGDDGDAPHERAFTLGPVGSIAEFLEALRAESKLASISGGHATWVLRSARPLAVAAQQWSAVRLIKPLDHGDIQRVQGELTFHWDYLEQVDPLATWQRLQTP